MLHLFAVYMQILGGGLITLLWVSATWGGIALWEAYRRGGVWRQAGRAMWLIHTLALLGSVGLLLYVLLAHRYEFHYAWTHGSRLLPTEYITAALWEGQEGSFLLWMLWHGLLGWLIYLSKDPYRWGLLAGLLFTNAYLATFLLGVTLPVWSIAVGVGLFWGLWAAEGLPLFIRIGGALLLGGAVFIESVAIQVGLILIVFFLFIAWKLPLRAALGAVAMLFLPHAGQWGSFPFLYVWEARPDMPAGMIPADGNGLNPLLQSFWMVIHPPVLFGGYAAAALPFWEGILTLQRGGLTFESSRRLLRWLWVAVSLLGLGIALGAYWAYETLNFGGYWNWDPVENASFAPWLVLVAAAHLLWAWRRHKKGASLALFFTLLGFPLVLYSSYLTRSGVLAESSVHSFTDLGLGEWLLWGVGVSISSLVFLFLPQVRALSPTTATLLKRSALAVGTLLLGWIAFILLLFTSLPALNKVLGTNWTLGSRILQVYYEWVGVFTVPVLVLMGYALMQAYRSRRWEAILWGGGATLGTVVIALWWVEWDFVYHPIYRSMLASDSFLQRLRGAFFLLLDDLLWGSALVALGGGIAVGVHHWRSKGKWAAFAHAGFALMVIGALLSSGYEKVLSQNFNPRSPGSSDNLFLPHGGSTVAIGYFVKYEGLLEPFPPIRQVRAILREKGQTLWRFRDSLGYPYQVWLPEADLSGEEGIFRPVSIPSMHTFIEKNIALLPVEPADHRFRYKVILTTLDSSRSYSLLLEADLSESSGLLAHPAHIRRWDGDLYVHLTSLPQVEGAPIAQGIVSLGLRDTIEWEGLTLSLEKLTEVEGMPHPTFRAWLAAWRGLPEAAQRFPVEFMIREREMVTPTASVAALGLSAYLESVSVKESRLRFRLVLRRRPDSFITLKILYKPFISLFWGGILLTLIGTVGAAFRHAKR